MACLPDWGAEWADVSGPDRRAGLAVLLVRHEDLAGPNSSFGRAPFLRVWREGPYRGVRMQATQRHSYCHHGAALPMRSRPDASTIVLLRTNQKLMWSPGLAMHCHRALCAVPT